MNSESLIEISERNGILEYEVPQILESKSIECCSVIEHQ